MLDPIIINPKVYKYLYNFAWSLVPKRRYITLAWDIFKPKNINPVYVAKGQDAIAPPYCLVFGIRIVNEHRFQPIGTIFLYYTSSPEKLANCVRAYIKDLRNCELKVVATICSGDQILIAIVHKLAKIEQESTDAIVYDVKNVKNIVHIYHTPGLLVATRDAFFGSELQFMFNGKEYHAHYENLKELAKKVHTNIFDLNLLAKNSSTKYVMYAAKFFSTTYATKLVKSKSPECIGCAKMCIFFDQLFDTFNTFEEISPKFRQVIKSDSKHFRLWKQAIPVLESMKFTTKSNEIQKKSEIDISTNEIKEVEYNYSSKIPQHLKNIFNDNVGPENDKDIFKNIVINLLKLKCLMEANNISLSDLNTFYQDFDIETDFIFEEYYRPKFLDHWIVSIKGMELICKNLFAKGFTTIRTKSFNADHIHESVQYIRVFHNNVKPSNVVERDNYLTCLNKQLVLAAFEASSTLTIY